MKSAKTTQAIITMLAEQHPNADTELHYRNAFELLVATILSAQSTDQRVNLVTPTLFQRFPDAPALANAASAELEKLVMSTGFFRQKSKALIGMATALVEQHGGNVPASMDALTQLPGVGRKTANVVLGHALGVPGLPVDRHVLRVANRIGIADSDDPEAAEAQLCGLLPDRMWTLASDVQILHGRRICRPKPLCDECAVRAECDYYRLVISQETPPSRTNTSRPKPARRTAAAPPAGSRRPSGLRAEGSGLRAEPSGLRKPGSRKHPSTPGKEPATSRKADDDARTIRKPRR